MSIGTNSICLQQISGNGGFKPGLRDSDKSRFPFLSLLISQRAILNAPGYASLFFVQLVIVSDCHSWPGPSILFYGPYQESQSPQFLSLIGSALYISPHSQNDLRLPCHL